MKNEFRIFPDMCVICNDMQKTGYTDIVEISCCIRGICEYFANGEYSYLSKGDCIIIKHSSYSDCRISCSTNCCTVTLLIESRSCNTEINELIGTTDYLHKLQINKANVLHDERVKMLFTGLYNECADNNFSLIKIKALELLILLKDKRIEYNSKYEKIKNTGRFICEHISEHYTIAQLSEMFEIDGTTLKSLFRQIHGCPVYNYAKNRKMFRAAELLRTTDMKVIDIAEEVGYSNASKFSSAFRDVMGVNPKYYQMEHNSFCKKSKDGILQNMAY